MASSGGAPYCHCLRQVASPQTTDSGWASLPQALPDLVLLLCSRSRRVLTGGGGRVPPICECSSLKAPIGLLYSTLLKNLGQFPAGGLEEI